MSNLMPREIESSTAVPSTIYAYLSFNSQGGKSVLEAKTLDDSSAAYHGRTADIDQALKVAAENKLEIIAQSPLGVSVAGPPEAFVELTGGEVITKEILVFAEHATTRYITHLDIVGNEQPTALGCGRLRSQHAGLEAVILERPRTPLASTAVAAAPIMALPSGGVWPSPIPPSPAGFYLRVPQDVALGLGAPEALRMGFRGDGVNVAMVDTGQYTHPFFAAQHYHVLRPITMVPNTTPGGDPIGHGTGESANIFAAAPNAVLQPIRASNNSGQLVAAIAGFLKAKSLRPKIITNSWGGDMTFPPLSNTLPPDAAALALEIKHAVESGIFVVFSAGNGHFSVEPQVPEVFAAGGVFMSSNLALQASNYSSGYRSPFFPNRNVPDACGLVGLLPRAAYIMLPVPPGSELDTGQSQPDEEGNAGDGTAPNDGWALFSGTSAAAPQVAGVAALLLSVNPALTPAQIKEALVKTAIDVTSGRCHPRFNFSAEVGPDVATGTGLVNAGAAVKYVRDHFSR